jgi:hypothetical protein
MGPIEEREERSEGFDPSHFSLLSPHSSDY